VLAVVRPHELDRFDPRVPVRGRFGVVAHDDAVDLPLPRLVHDDFGTVFGQVGRQVHVAPTVPATVGLEVDIRYFTAVFDLTEMQPLRLPAPSGEAAVALNNCNSDNRVCGRKAKDERTDGRRRAQQIQKEKGRYDRSGNAHRHVAML